MPISIDTLWALDLGAMAFIFGIFLLGATVKGALGVGFPLIAVPLLSMYIPPQQAMGLLVVPVLASNALQAFEQGSILPVIRRMDRLLIAQFVIMFATVWWTTSMKAEDLRPFVGGSVLLAAALLMYKPQFLISKPQEAWLGIVVGAGAGFIGGVSSLTGPVVIAYLMALGLKRDAFVSHISVIYFFTALPMYLTMWWFDRFGLMEMGVSCLALLPMAAGLWMGKRLRKYLNEQIFRRLLLMFLVVMSILLMR